MTTPRHYDDPFQEYWHNLLESVTVWDVGGAARQVEIAGPDAIEFTNMLMPRDIERCADGQCKYVVMTDLLGARILEVRYYHLRRSIGCAGGGTTSTAAVGRSADCAGASAEATSVVAWRVRVGSDVNSSQTRRVRPPA